MSLEGDCSVGGLSKQFRLSFSGFLGGDCILYFESKSETRLRGGWCKIASCDVMLWFGVFLLKGLWEGWEGDRDDCISVGVSL